MLPPILQGHEMLGSLRSGSGLPLPAGIPVFVGGHDGVCANLGAGMVAVGDGCVTLGTNAVLRVNTFGPLYPTPQFHTFTYPYLREIWTSGGDVLDAGGAVVWTARLLGLLDGGSAEAAAALERFDALAAAAAVGSGGLICLPYLRGRISPRMDLERRGAFVNIGLEHGRQDVARSVLEGVAFSLRQIQDGIRQSGHEIREVCLTGGGARSRLWPTIVASVLDRPLAHVEAQASLKGALILVAVGLDLYSSIGAAVGGMVRGGESVDPNPAWATVYDEVYRRYLGKSEAV